jgi:hypothetical protein
LDNFDKAIVFSEKDFNLRELSFGENMYNPKGFCFGWKSFSKLIYLFLL